ncbi:hypothetical protein [Rhizobium sp. G21]|uniref:hypothetical protein n=1 Tax=Rhizobium sp. G21 TaxID=2758439 RepID=UPI0016047393|nr:hypothetical protein [Rhizobium sp. G21]MBB1248396.1 hypothetical protein [Rhizobium sp. G21]
MTVYIERSLVGTENNDQLSYSITHVGNGNSDVFIHYTSIYGLGGEDEITNDADWKDIFIDAGAGNDRFKAGAYSSGTVLGGEGDDQINCYVEDTSYTILGEAGNDTVSYYVDYYDKTSRLDGGDGEDHLVFGGNYSTDRITGFETLALKGSIRINKGKLSDFKSVDPGSATIMFAHAADVADVAFVKGASSIAIIGSSVADNLDLTNTTAAFRFRAAAAAT